MVFSLVWAAFATVYITQPVLPVLQLEFGVTPAVASVTVSVVVLGMALANLPFGVLADRYPVRRLIMAGGLMVAGSGLVIALTATFPLLVAARFLQGLFIPALTTCLAAYLACTLPAARLNVVMGSYVSATVAGGLSGRLLGGWLHPPLHWRYAFVTSSIILLVVTLVASRGLPPYDPRGALAAEPLGFKDILSQPALRRLYLVPLGGFAVFSASFNYLPFYLAAPPLALSTQAITMVYLTYITGIVIGPLAGQVSNKVGNGATIILGAVILALSLSLTLSPSLWLITPALVGVCAGFFALHAAAAGALNRQLTVSCGRANSLYVLFYYLGGSLGITLAGYTYSIWGWPGVVGMGLMLLTLPVVTGVCELKHEERAL